MRSLRAQKTFKLNYWKQTDKPAPFIQISDGPSEAKLAASKETFVSARETGVTLSPGKGNDINIQALSGNLHYAGMIQDLPFPLSLIPTTPFTPFPKQVFSPPLKELVPIIAQLSIIATSFVGV